MLSYLHAHHAGNFADVHKHVALVWVLRALAAKDAPFAYYDTHAGSGVYDLESPRARRGREADAGIGRLWGRRDLPGPVSDYLERVRQANPGGRLRVYPGSPALALAGLRERDRAVLVERHPGEGRALRAWARRDRRAHVHLRDGWEALVALVPPAERRGLVLVDPSYEVRADYSRAADALGRAWRRWRNGVYLLWYPLLPGDPHRALVAALAAAGIRGVLGCELEVRPAGSPMGLRGSGLVLVNPPWHAREALDESGSALAGALADPRGRHASRWIAPE